MKTIHTVLSIAGSDPSGGAGIQADLKTFAAYQVGGRSVIASITVQNTSGVRLRHDLPPDLVGQQLAAVLEDGKPKAVKTGMLGNERIVNEVARQIKRFRLKNLVVDPVIRSTSGHILLSAEGVEALRKNLIPAALLVTPNLKEAEILSGISIRRPEDRIKAARKILKIGVANVLIKGGHLKGNPEDLLYDGKRPIYLGSERLAREQIHGTGCVLSSAIAAELSKGKDMVAAVGSAKEFMRSAILGRVCSGRGISSVEPLAGLYRTREKYELIRRVSSALEILKNARIGRLIPEVQSNIAVALENAQTYDEVIGFPGRVIKNGDDIVTLAPPEFGGSRHVADIVLTAMRYDPEKRAVMNIKYDRKLLDICRGLKFKMASFDRAREPKKVRVREGSSLEWGTDDAIRRYGGVPDIIHDAGGVGKEEMIRVIAKDIETLVSRILKIHQRYK